MMFAIRASASPHNPADPHLAPPRTSSCSTSSSSSSSHPNPLTSNGLTLKKQLKDARVKSNNSSSRLVVSAASASGAAFPLVSSGQQLLERAMEGGMMSLQRVCLIAGMAGQALKVWGEQVLSYRSLKFYKFPAEQIQASIEKGILDTRFTTLIAVAGSLMGSIVCFLNGCSLIIEAYIHYMQRMWQHASIVDQGETIHILIEAIDMFLVGTGLLNFGMAMYIMFVGSRGMRAYTASGQNLAGILHQMIHRPSMGTKWVYHAKAKLGHAVVMILQAGTVEKFASVPVANGLDLACFAGAVLLSSATVFLLSRLNPTTTNTNDGPIHK